MSWVGAGKEGAFYGYKARCRWKAGFRWSWTEKLWARSEYPAQRARRTRSARRRARIRSSSPLGRQRLKSPQKNMAEKTVYLSLGSNVGERGANLRAAIAALDGAGVR